MKRIQKIATTGILSVFSLGIMSFTIHNLSDDDGIITVGEMRATKSLRAVLPNFDFDAKCNVVSFTMYHVPKNQDVATYINRGGDFNAQVLKAVQSARIGDQYQFVDVRGRCPGDADDAQRPLNSLAFLVR